MVTTGKFPGNILGISGEFLEETKNPRALESSDSGHREFSKELWGNKGGCTTKSYSQGN